MIDEEAPLVRDLGDELDHARAELIPGHRDDRGRLDALQHLIVDDVDRYRARRAHRARCRQALGLLNLLCDQLRRSALAVSCDSQTHQRNILFQNERVSSGIAPARSRETAAMPRRTAAHLPTAVAPRMEARATSRS